MYILGKALGGGIVPLSAVVSRWDILEVMRPGEHGSTFGGNPLAAAIGREVVAMIATGEMQERSSRLGQILAVGLASAAAHGARVDGLRTRGLCAGLDLGRPGPTGRQFSQRLAERGIIAKDTQGQTIRFAPPLTTSEDDIRWAVSEISAALNADREIVTG